MHFGWTPEQVKGLTESQHEFYRRNFDAMDKDALRAEREAKQQ